MSTQAPHTPGPWVWDGNTLRPANPDPDHSAVYSILDAEGGYGFLGSDWRATGAELDADRALIAKAPDLLAMLRKIADRDFTFIDGFAQISRADVLEAREALRMATPPPPTHT
jgi:hypothetical protein